jgi:hypothetical protein
MKKSGLGPSPSIGLGLWGSGPAQLYKKVKSFSGKKNFLKTQSQF